jgi:hypothetical protein
MALLALNSGQFVGQADGGPSSGVTLIVPFGNLWWPVSITV